MLPAVLAGLAGCATAPVTVPVTPPATARAPAPAPATAPATPPATPSVTAPADLAPSLSATPVPDQPSLSPPARIRLPSLGVDAPVVASGVDERGEMQVPDDIRETGWYRFSPPPGSAAGSSVVAGHVDDRVQGRGAFYDLAGLAVGDPVVVTTTTGVDLDYRVSDVRRIAKQALPVDELFALDGPPRLTLVTCGGSFDRATRNYRDNTVVTAVPVR